MNIEAVLKLPVLTSPSQDTISDAGLHQMVVIKYLDHYENEQCAEEGRDFDACINN